MSKTLTTGWGREIKISPNQSKKTITIRSQGLKYRTLPMNEEEFESASLFWTGNDWNNFLRNTQDYYVV